MSVKTFKNGQGAFDDALRFDMGAGEGVSVAFPNSSLGSVDLLFDLVNELVFFRTSARFDVGIVVSDKGACHVGEYQLKVVNVMMSG